MKWINKAADSDYVVAIVWLADRFQMNNEGPQAIALYDRAAALGDEEAGRSATTLRRWEYEKTPEGKAEIAANRQRKAAAAETAEGSPRVLGDAICRTLLEKGTIRSAAFVNYFEPGGMQEWDRLPSGIGSLVLRYRFTFATQAGLLREYNGYIVMKRDNGWTALVVNVDGVSDIPAKVAVEGGFYMR